MAHKSDLPHRVAAMNAPAHALSAPSANGFLDAVCGDAIVVVIDIA
ncbi:hypothetical protein [Sphingomonas sp. GM_Shp_1]|nr:hypothetical protein [Sphingomonas sp. GM_Shp_1]